MNAHDALPSSMTRLNDSNYRKRVGIVIFDDVEVLDFCGPFEVFSVTRQFEHRRREEASPFEVMLVAHRMSAVTTTGGMKVIPDVTFENCPPLDILVVAGGWGTRALMHDQIMLSFVRAHVGRGDTVASVCTGALVLAASGVLDGLRATTHWAALDLMQSQFPQVTVESHSRVVSHGKVVTSAGIAAGIDMALQLVAQHCGDTVARLTARYMEYPYTEQ